MPQKRYTPEEIIQHLRTVELETAKGVAVLDAWEARDHRTNLLSVEEGVRRAACRLSQTAQELGAGERSAQTDRRRPGC